MTLLDSARTPAAAEHSDHLRADDLPYSPAPGSVSAPPVAAWAVGLVCAGAALLLSRDDVVLQTWATVALAVVLQALPFLVLGVLLSGAVAAFVPAGLLPRLLPRRAALSVPLAGLAGIALPGCECSSVPVAGRLVAAGAPPAAALTFMVAAPAVNPLVLVATFVAFPGEPRVAVARLLASLLAAMIIGSVWARFGPALQLCGAHEHGPVSGRLARIARLRDVLVADFAAAAGWLVLGGALAASLQVLVPRRLLGGLAGDPVVAVLALALLAVLLAVCSEADAFVAAGLTQFSLSARLAFLVVGPMVDVKLVALQVGTFGRGFALRFAPLALLSATASAVLVGRLMLR